LSVARAVKKKRKKKKWKRNLYMLNLDLKD
jgi:hypothetical protein